MVPKALAQSMLTIALVGSASASMEVAMRSFSAPAWTPMANWDSPTAALTWAWSGNIAAAVANL
eukprot:4530972-Alexandrium_andersonii.AAC.1